MRHLLLVILLIVGYPGFSLEAGGAKPPEGDELMRLYRWASEVGEVLSSSVPISDLGTKIHPSVAKAVSMKNVMSGVTHSAAYLMLKERLAAGQKQNLSLKAFVVPESQLTPNKAGAAPPAVRLYQVYARWRTEDDERKDLPGVQSTLMVIVDKETSQFHLVAFSGFGVGSDILELAVIRSAFEGGLLDH